MKYEGASQTADLMGYLDNNRLIVHCCGFDITRPLPSYWTYARIIFGGLCFAHLTLCIITPFPSSGNAWLRRACAAAQNSENISRSALFFH